MIIYIPIVIPNAKSLHTGGSLHEQATGGSQRDPHMLAHNMHVRQLGLQTARHFLRPQSWLTIVANPVIFLMDS
jgi:hypothetical protein